MKLETGSNTTQFTHKVSIQLALDGHSFSSRTLQALDALPADQEAVEVELLTRCTMLVPTALFDAADASALLAANGMPAAADEVTVFSDPHPEGVAVMALSAKVMRRIADKLGDRAHFTSPLLCVPSSMTEATVWLRCEARLLYIKVYDGELRFAEVLPVATDADVLYFFERLGREFTLANYQLHLTGDQRAPVRKLLGKRFKRVLCE
ncbi:MAG: hypothetical protein RR270_07215 [Alistipes sp.]